MIKQSYTIAAWRFDPTEPILRAGAEERRLEDRAARVLEVLCRRRGEIVSKDELIAAVWGGRNVSPNSVSIVIGSLRRALGDDIESPALLVTIARRGYRLEKAPGAPSARAISSAEAPSRQKRIGLVRGGALIAICLVASVFLHRSRPPETIPVLVEAPRNETGQVALEKLASSLGPVVVHSAGRLHGVRLVDDARVGEPRIVIKSRLILWNGAPEMALSAIDTATHSIVWSSFAPEPPALLARHVDDSLVSLQRKLPSTRQL